MAKKTSIINVVVAGDSKPLRKALGKATKSLGAFSKKVAQVGLAGGVAMAGLGVKAIDLAVDFEESLSKAQQIFGGVAGNIELAANKAATAVGMSKSEFLEAASTFGVFGKASGLSGVELSMFAEKMVQTAADVASFNNLRPEEAVEKLAAGLRGSTEPLQSVGVLMNAAQVEAEALAMGLIEVGDELTEGQKIMARHSLIMQQLGEQGAMGDFARTSDGLANKQRILTARIKNLGIELGTVLLPVAEKLASGIEFLIGKFEAWSPAIRGAMEAVAEFLAPAAELARKWLPWLGQKIVDFAKFAWPGVTKAFEVTRDFIKDDLIPKFAEIIDYLKEKLPAAGQAFIDHIDRNRTKYTILAGAIGGLAVAFGLLVLKAKVGAAVAALYALAGGVTALNVSLAVGLGFFAFVGAMAALYITSEKFRDFTGGIFDWFIEEAKEAREIVQAIIDGLEKISNFDLRDVPGFGWIPDSGDWWGGWGSPGLETAPDGWSMGSSDNNKMTSSAQGGGTTINVNMPAGSDGQDVVAALQRYVRQNGAADIATSNLVRI
jgi:hypothetical protein